jgi:hypothetical protein
MSAVLWRLRLQGEPGLADEAVDETRAVLHPFELGLLLILRRDAPASGVSRVPTEPTFEAESGSVSDPQALNEAADAVVCLVVWVESEQNATPWPKSFG